MCLPVLAPAGAWARAGEGGGRRVLREHFVLDHAGRTVLSDCLAFDHACCLPHSAKQDGLRYVVFLFRRGSRSPVVRSRIDSAVIGFRGFTSGLSVSLWRSRRRTKGQGNAGDGERGRRRGGRALLREHIGFVMLSAGSTLGLRAPDCAKETRLPGLSSFDSRRGCVSRGEGHSGMTET